MRKIRPFMDTPVIKVISGIRRCGKSVMMELIQEELLKKGILKTQILALNFESKADIRVNNLASVIDAVHRTSKLIGKKIYLFFDEIQELDGWETLINSFLIDIDADIYITGSNAHLLSGELATYLSGRYVEIKMFPFSYQEVITLLSEQHSHLNQSEIFLLYLQRGGFPFLYNYLFSDTDANKYISDLFDSIILKDISQRHNVRDIAQLRQIISFFIANIGNTFSAGAILKYLKNQHRSMSTETLYNYIDYCRSACLLQLVQRNDIMGKALLATQQKMYLTDHGIRQAVYGNNQRDIQQLLENIVFMELLRRDYDVTIGKVNTKEVDFCAKKGTDVVYIQVAYLLATEETVEREFAALESIPDNYPKYVLSMDEIDRSRNGVIHKNIRKFLLEDCI